MTRPTLQAACSAYPHRYTMEHVPDWARKPQDGKFYAPHYASDRDWYDNTTFPGEVGHLGGRSHCFSSGQTWPAGQWLDAPFNAKRA